MALDYRRERESKNEKLTENVLSELPKFVSDFIDYISVTRSDTTTLSYSRDLKQFIEYIQKHFDKDNHSSLNALAKIKTVDIKDYERYLFKKENLSNTTIKRRMSSIASLYKYLNGNDLISNNPMINYDYPRAEDHEIIYLTEEQTIDFLSGIKKNQMKTIEKETGAFDKNNKAITEKVPVEKSIEERLKDEKFVLRDYAITMLILGSALRVSELVGIDINDINFDENYLVTSRKGRQSSLKRVYFGEEVKKALLDYLDGESIPKEIVKKYPANFLSFCSQNREKADLVEMAIKEFDIKEEDESTFKEDVLEVAMATARLGRKSLRPKPGENALFLSSWGKRLSVRSVQLMIKEAAYCYLPDMKNKDNITPHKLRSTAATRMLYQTEDILLVSKQLDHSSPDVTAKFYAKLLEDKEREKVANLSVTSWDDKGFKP